MLFLYVQKALCGKSTKLQAAGIEFQKKLKLVHASLPDHICKAIEQCTGTILHCNSNRKLTIGMCLCCLHLAFPFIFNQAVLVLSS